MSKTVRPNLMKSQCEKQKKIPVHELRLDCSVDVNWVQTGGECQTGPCLRTMWISSPILGAHDRSLLLVHLGPFPLGLGSSSYTFGYIKKLKKQFAVFFNENQQKSMEINCKSSEIIKKIWTSMEINGNLWKLTEINEKSVEIYEPHQTDGVWMQKSSN